MKTVGTDHLFVEAIQLEPKIMASFLVKILEVSRKIKYPLKDCKGTILVLLHNIREGADTANHLLIALLSHGRKVVEPVIATEIWKTYHFQLSQMEFLKATGTETAIFRQMFDIKNNPYTDYAK